MSPTKANATTQFAYKHDSQRFAPSNTVHVFWDDAVAVLEGIADAKVSIGCIDQIGLLSGVTAGMQINLGFVLRFTYPGNLKLLISQLID